MDHQERMKLAQRSLEGLSVGDAFGQRFFTHPSVLMDMLDNRTLPKAPWRWTDDTAMALSVVDDLRDNRGIQSDSLARRFADRYLAEPHRGYGGGAHELLASIGRGASWKDAAASLFGGQGSYGNGGAMRVAPVGAYFWDDPEAAANHAEASAAPTHAHPEGVAGAVAIAVATSIATKMGRDGRIDGPTMLERVTLACPGGLTRDGLETACKLPFSKSVDAVAPLLGNGSQVSSQDTIPLSVWCAAKYLGNFEEAMWATVRALGDRDTTCAIVGGVIATSCKGLPEEWLTAREPLDSPP